MVYSCDKVSLKMEFTEANRLAVCVRLGLPASTRWNRLVEIQRETLRISYCIELGMPLNSSWGSIARMCLYRHQRVEGG